MGTRKGLLYSVALVGIDGSGKSTQVDWLCKRLRQQGKIVQSIHPFGWKLLSFLSHYSRPESHSIEVEKRKPSLIRRLAAWIEVVDLGIYDWFWYMRCLQIARNNHEEVWLVSDRSFDDLLLKHQSLGTISPQTLALLRCWLPQTNQTLWLKTDPQVALERDGEFTESYYVQRHQIYLLAARQYGWKEIITSGRTRESIFADILEALGLDTQLSSGQMREVLPNSILKERVK